MNEQKLKEFIIKKDEKEYQFKFEKEGNERLIIIAKEKKGGSYRGVFEKDEICKRDDITINSIQTFLDEMYNSFIENKVEVVPEEAFIKLCFKVYYKQTQLTLPLAVNSLYSKLSNYGRLFEKCEKKIKFLSERFNKGKNIVAHLENQQNIYMQNIIQHLETSQQQLQTIFDKKANEQAEKINEYFTQIQNSNSLLLENFQQTLQINFNEQSNKIQNQQTTFIHSLNQQIDLIKNTLNKCLKPTENLIQSKQIKSIYVRKNNTKSSFE